MVIRFEVNALYAVEALGGSNITLLQAFTRGQRLERRAYEVGPAATFSWFKEKRTKILGLGTHRCYGHAFRVIMDLFYQS